MADNQERKDPVDRYYKPVELIERLSDALFWIAAVLSLVVLFVEREKYPVLFQIVQISFAVSVIGLFASILGLRLYFTPHAEDQRRLGFISNSYDVALTHEKTVGFYNNPETEPLVRVGLSLMENCFFSRAVIQNMLKRVRIIVALYILLFFIAVFVRSTDLAIIPIAAQAVFSEQIISRWLRLEWLSSRCDSIYKRLYDLFQAPPPARIRNARILDALTAYETSKANASVALSSSIFHKLNPYLTKEWNDILAALKRVPTTD